MWEFIWYTDSWKETGTKYRGLSPHKITPMLGVLHAEARWFGFTNGYQLTGPGDAGR